MEGSLVQTASSLVRKRALVAGARTSGSWGRTYDGEDKPHATIGHEADLTDHADAELVGAVARVRQHHDPGLRLRHVGEVGRVAAGSAVVSNYL